MQVNREKRPANDGLPLPPPKRLCSTVTHPGTASTINRELALAELADFADLVPVEGEKAGSEVRAQPHHQEPPKATFKAPQPKISKKASLPIDLPLTTFRVPRDREPFLEFIARWRQVPRYAFSLAWIPNGAAKKLGKTASRASHGEDEEDEEIGSRSLSNPVTATMANEDLVFFPDALKAIALIVTWDKSRCYTVNLTASKKNPGDALLHKERMKLVQEVLEMPETEKVVFDCKPQLKLLLNLNISVVHGIRDPRIASWMLQPDTHKDPLLRDLFIEYADSIAAKATSRIEYAPGLGDTEKALRSSIILAHQSLLVMSALDHELNLNSMYDLFINVEMKLVPILAKMEFYGVGFSEEALLKARGLIETKINNLESRARRFSKREFDLNSPMEVSDLLFDHLKLPYPALEVGGMRDGFAVGVLQGENNTSSASTSHAAAPTRTKRIDKSTRAEVLQAMARAPNPHPLPNIILEHRTLSHTVNNYMDPLPTFSYHSKKLDMRRIYSTCHQTCVPTGRLAFDNPNLQSIRHAFEFVPVRSPSCSTSHTSSTSQSPPSSDSVPSPVGAPIEINIRDSFIAAPNMTLVSFDYCQLELRIMAHYAEDEGLLKKLSDPQVDMFTVIAGQWLVKAPSEVNAHERAQAKHICYGILYGMGIAVLSRTLKVTKAEAKRFRVAFQERFSGLSRFLTNAVALTKECGYSETLAGRRRHFPHVYATGRDKTSRADYARAVRQITNTVCQGSAADIVKIATIRIEEMLREEAPESRCIINLHDELVYELPTSLLDQLVPRMQNIMETVMTLRLPLPVRIFYGPTWGHLAPWPPQSDPPTDPEAAVNDFKPT